MTIKTDRSGAMGCVMIVALAAALALSACGRKGDLDRPGVTPPPQQGTASETLTGGFSSTGGGPDAPPIAPQRRFLLDPLLD